jgi:hypothetical protein
MFPVRDPMSQERRVNARRRKKKERNNPMPESACCKMYKRDCAFRPNR